MSASSIKAESSGSTGIKRDPGLDEKDSKDGLKTAMDLDKFEDDDDDDDDFEDTGELEIPAQENSAWLTRIPRMVYNSWAEIEDDEPIQLGYLRHYEDSKEVRDCLGRHTALFVCVLKCSCRSTSFFSTRQLVTTRRFRDSTMSSCLMKALYRIRSCFLRKTCRASSDENARHRARAAIQRMHWAQGEVAGLTSRVAFRVSEEAYLVSVNMSTVTLHTR